MREAHELCDEENDVATASLLENWIDQTERRVWFLFETSRRGAPAQAIRNRRRVAGRSKAPSALPPKTLPPNRTASEQLKRASSGEGARFEHVASDFDWPAI